MLHSAGMNREQFISAGGLGVKFAFCQDRFAHEICVADGDVWKTVLTSIEGTPNDDWPVSPPLQSLAIEPREHAQLALLVGMSGKSHWSTSVELQASGRLSFDIACRVRGEARGFLGSSYRAIAPAELVRSDLVRIIGPGGSCLEVSLVAQAELPQFHLAADSLEIVTQPPCGPAPLTVRWQFAISRVN